jgi:hypothetical protein
MGGWECGRYSFEHFMIKLDITSMISKGDRIGNDADPVTAYFTRFTAYHFLQNTVTHFSRYISVTIYTYQINSN